DGASARGAQALRRDREIFVRTGILSFLSFLFLAANLRPSITAVGPLVASIQNATGLSAAAVGVLTSLPLLAFGAFAPLANFGRRVGLERTLAIAMLMLFAGILLRSAGSSAALFAGTLVLSAGVAVGNVLAPSLIKRDYPDRIGTLTTVYALILALTAAVGSGLAVPVERALPGGWRSALAIWAVPAALAAMLWARASFRPRRSAAPSIEASPTSSVWRSPLAWYVSGFMGLQSTCVYVVVSWFPPVLPDGGDDPARAGLLVTGFQLGSFVAGGAVPRLLALRQDQSALAVLASLAIAAGVLGVLWHPEWTPAWVTLAGAGVGVCFPLALAFIGLRTADHHQAASLSLMSQSIGYLIAASGPLLFGLAHDLSGGWEIPLAGLAGCALMQAIVGFRGGQNRTVAGTATCPGPSPR